MSIIVTISKERFTSSVFQATLMLLFLSTICSLEGTVLAETQIYKNESYGFTFVPPQGWELDQVASQDLINQERRKNKDAVGFFFVNPESQEGFTPMMVFLTPADPTFRGKEGKVSLIKELKGGLKSSNQVFKTEELTIDNQPALQVVGCIGPSSQKDCKLIRHVTHILTPHADVRIAFFVSADLYPRYVPIFDRTLATISINPDVIPKKLPKCQESDIKVSEHHLRPAEAFSGKKIIKWEATLKNIGAYRCLTAVALQLLNQEGEVLEVLLGNDAYLKEVIEPNSSAKFRGSVLIGREEFAKMVSDRIVITKVE